MSDVIERCADLPRRTWSSGAVIVEQGGPWHSILILVEGSVLIERDGVALAELETRGSILGEMSILLGTPATATLTALEDCSFLLAEDGHGFLTERPDILFDVARAVATRLDNLTGHLTDVKRQYGDDTGHLGMLDDVLSTLMHHQTKPVQPGSARMPELDY